MQKEIEDTLQFCNESIFGRFIIHWKQINEYSEKIYFDTFIVIISQLLEKKVGIWNRPK